MFNVLDQLNIQFEYQKSDFLWSKNVKHDNSRLCGDKRYDFYVPLINAIIETHGSQHYDKKFKMDEKDLKEIKENDLLKKSIAVKNGISNYITIDCSKSELYSTKNNILDSELSKLLDLSNVNWLKCHEYACKNLVKEVCNLYQRKIKLVDIQDQLKISITTIINYLKQGNILGWCNYQTQNDRAIEKLQIACDYWNSGFKSTIEIGRLMSMNRDTIGKYLRQGSKIGLCDYNIEKVHNKQINNLINANNRKKRKFICLNTKEIFNSMTEANNKYNINISSTCQGRCNYAGRHPETGEPLKWMYYDDYIEQQNKNNLEIS
jgi:DNA-binding CsgD family transcriptional regulator